VNTLWGKLTTLSAHPTVQGKVVDLQQIPSIADAYAAWDANFRDQNRANTVAETIKISMTDELRRNAQFKRLQHHALFAE
jgi:hypothetical protein